MNSLKPLLYSLGSDSERTSSPQESRFLTHVVLVAPPLKLLLSTVKRWQKVASHWKNTDIMKVPLTEKRQKRKNKQTEEIVLDVCVLCFSVPSICISGNTIFSKYKHFIASVTCQFGFLLPMTNIHFEAKIHWHCSGSILWQLSTCLSPVYCRPLALVTFLLYCMCMPSSPVNTGFTNQPGLKSWGSLSAITKLRLTVLQVERTNDEVINDWTIKIISLPVFVCKSRVFTEGLVHRKYPTISPRIAN